MLTLHGSITAHDYAEALRVMQTPRRSIAALGGLLLIASVWACAIGVQKAWAGQGSWLSPAVIFWFLLFCPFWFFVSIPWRARRIYQQQRSMRESFDTAVTEDGFTNSTVHGSSVSDWSYFRKWAEGPNVFILYQSDAFINILPKRLFAAPEQVDQFRELVAGKLPRAANNSFKPKPLRDSA